MKFNKWFDFTETEAEAKAKVKRFNNTHKGWKKHQAHYTPWESTDKKDKMHFIVWSWR